MTTFTSRQHLDDYDDDRASITRRTTTETASSARQRQHAHAQRLAPSPRHRLHDGQAAGGAHRERTSLHHREAVPLQSIEINPIGRVEIINILVIGRAHSAGTIDVMRRPHSIADRSRVLHDLSKRKDDDLAHEKIRLPLHEARTKARQFINESPAGGYATIIENWRQLADGQIEFTIRRLPTAD